MKITCTVFALLIQTLQCLAFDDSPFQLTNKASGFCLVTRNNYCNDIRWTTGDRLLIQQIKKCVGAQGKSVGSEISLYDCDENSELQKWECKNETVIALKDQELYIELTADNTAVLSKRIGSSNHLTISGKSSGACTRTYRELYTIGGNAAGMPCMFPFKYKDQWYSDCTTLDSPENRLWCAVETKFQSERWGYCPITSKEGWNRHPTTGAYYQLNTQSALTWPQAEMSCKQQGASLLSITDPHQHAYVTALLGTAGNKFWIGLILDPEHGWKWSNGRPYRYMKWDSGYPFPNPGHNCVNVEPAVQYYWQNSPCTKKLGYICYSKAEELPTLVAEAGFCSSPWIPYNGHCFYVNRTQKTWSDAQRKCRNLGGDLVSIHNVEEQSFVVSQLRYEATDELWIGLNDRKTEGLFDWADLSDVSFTSWEYGRPAVSSEIQDCVLMTGANGNWADRVCEEKHGSICMKMSSPKSTEEKVLQDEGCKPGWKRHGSYCYFIGSETKTFNGARDDCKRCDSYLADVSNGVDNAFLVSLVGTRPEKHFWLGLSNQNNIDKFVWTNTDSVRFTNWNALMPGRRKGCVAMTTGIFAGLWDLLPCTNKAKYICKHLAEGAGLTTPATNINPNECASQWTPLQSRDYCIKFFSLQYNTWYRARDYCQALGGDLLSIHSTEELKEVPYIHGPVWIGLSAPDPATGYVWSDRSPVQFLNWADGQPNNKNNVESCVEMRSMRQNMNGSWNDVHCEKYNSWLCQIPTGVTPKPTPKPFKQDHNRTRDGWLEWNGNQYLIVTMLMGMEDARLSCQKRHSDLITITSEAESVFLWKQFFRRGAMFYWIGLKVDLDGTYGWLDESPVVFQRWDVNQPRFLNNDENCAAMSISMGFWHSYNCGLEHGSICKRSGSPPPDATVALTVRPEGGCPPKWKKKDSKCFNIITDKNETWDGARAQCKAMGGNLASISTRHEQVFLALAMAEAPTTDLWIGLVNVNKYPFYWTDGRRLIYNNLAFSQRRHYPSFLDDIYERNYDVVSYEKECCVMSTSPNIGIGKWIKKPCNETTGYVCLRNVDPSFSSEPTTYTDYFTIFNDSIKAVTEPMTWNAAKRHCEGMGAKLASLRNEWSAIYSELMAINLRASLWIGLNRRETRGYFRYVDGWRLPFTKWTHEEPSEDCVYVNVNGKWQTDDCDTLRSSLCLKSTDVPPTEASDFPGFCPEYEFKNGNRWQQNNWIPFKGYCYLFIMEKIQWSEASVSCARHGASLASIEDPSEQDFIQSIVKIYQDSHRSFWIGLYKTHTGMLLWLDKVAMDYTNWDDRSFYNMDFGVVQSENGKWSLDNKWDRKPYICKTQKVLLQPPRTTVNPTMDPQVGGQSLLPVVLVISVIAVGIVIALIIVKKSGCRLSHLGRSSTFNNPLIFNNEQSQSNLVETN